MPEFLKKFLRQLQRSSDRWWYVPLMALLVFLDLFVAFIPSEALVVKTVILKPKRWWSTPLILTTAGALGSVALGYLAQKHGEAFVQWIVPGLFTSPEWQKTHDFIDKHGPWAIALISLGPVPQQPAVIFATLAKMSLPTLFFSVWLGRAPKYLLLGWVAKKSPHYFKKHFGEIYDELQSINGPTLPPAADPANGKTPMEKKDPSA